MSIKRFTKSVLLASLLMSLGACQKPAETQGADAPAASAATCTAVKFADIGWTDITATTALTSTVLEGLGYKAESIQASVPIAFAGIQKNQVDVFLGYWSPSMTPIVDPFLKTKSITVLPKPNLMGAKYTLAVPTYAYEAGLKSFTDIAKFKDQLEGKIYGIEPGNDGNKLIADMISKDQFGLKDFKMVESSEAGMLTQVSRSIKEKKMLVFLGWAPHPMNVQYPMSYLSGGDDVFGKDYGAAEVYTVVSNTLATRCPNVSKLVGNLEFNVDMEGKVMQPIMDKEAPNAAAKAWLKANPDALNKWLEGVTTVDGKPGLEAVKSFLGA